MSDTRPVTIAILQLCDDVGESAWKAVAKECLSYMSEADVADMNRTAEFVNLEEDEEDEE